jgi:hypothetical protein
MKWTELFWDNSLSVFENLATWALGVIMFTLFYIHSRFGSGVRLESLNIFVISSSRFVVCELDFT